MRYQKPLSKLSLASLPTPFHILNRFSRKLNGPTIWVKRDDLSGSLLSGNKVRKLEYTLAYAKATGHDLLITCGGLQSNHCRATAFAGAQLGVPVHLVLRGEKQDILDGNLFLDALAGATIHYHRPGEYQKNLPSILEAVAQHCRDRGYKPYIIPTGASNGVGVWGYFAACKELKEDFQSQGIQPQAIVTATGSGGTQAGLTLGSRYFDLGCDVTGIAVCDNEAYFQTKVAEDIDAFYTEFSDIFDSPALPKGPLSIQTIDRYIGEGYGIASDAVLDTIITLAQEEGILLDPVYTGKAFHGMVNEIQAGRFSGMSDIVFIHTGGHYGLFPYKERLSQKLTQTPNDDS